MANMKALVFIEKDRIELEDKPIPDVGPNDALIRVTTTKICGTYVQILKGEYPVVTGLTIGHDPVSFIEKLGSKFRSAIASDAPCSPTPNLPGQPRRLSTRISRPTLHRFLQVVRHLRSDRQTE